MAFILEEVLAAIAGARKIGDSFRGFLYPSGNPHQTGNKTRIFPAFLLAFVFASGCLNDNPPPLGDAGKVVSWTFDGGQLDTGMGQFVLSGVDPTNISTEMRGVWVVPPVLNGPHQVGCWASFPGYSGSLLLGPPVQWIIGSSDKVTVGDTSATVRGSRFENHFATFIGRFPHNTSPTVRLWVPDLAERLAAGSNLTVKMTALTTGTEPPTARWQPTDQTLSCVMDLDQWHGDSKLGYDLPGTGANVDVFSSSYRAQNLSLDFTLPQPGFVQFHSGLNTEMDFEVRGPNGEQVLAAQGPTPTGQSGQSGFTSLPAGHYQALLHDYWGFQNRGVSARFYLAWGTLPS